MKRLLSGILALGTAFSMSAGCGDADSLTRAETPTPPATQPTIPSRPTSAGGDPTMILVVHVGDTASAALTPGGGPVWSPDGDKIAFSSKRDGRYDLYVMNRDGSNLTRLTNDGSAETPNWSPDGSRIAWITDGTLKVMNSDGSDQVTVAQPIHAHSKLRVGGWSPDGQRLAFAGGDGSINVSNANGSGLATLAYSETTTWAVADLPSWSPDGRRIVFVGTSPCSLDMCLAIYTMTAQAVELTRVASGSAEDDRYPVWSPDGGHIAFLSYPGGDCADWCDANPNIPELQVMNADGTDRRTVFTAAIGRPTWSADSRALIVATSDSAIGPGIIAIPVSGGPARLLSPIPGVLSPDGQWIAYTR